MISKNKIKSVALLASPILMLPTLAMGENNKPNVLFCIADDASFAHFSAAGCTWVNTPNFDKVARQGLFFERCYTPNAKSAPSRSIVLTGRYSWQLGAAGNHCPQFPSDIKVFTEVLAENNYSVAYTGKGWAPGDPGVINGKPRLLTGQPFMELTKEPLTPHINRCDYAGNFKEFMDTKDDDKPWFFWFGSNEPHRAYAYESGVKLGNKTLEQVNNIPSYYPDNDVTRNDMLDYALELETYDKQVGEVLAILEESGELDNTIIIITADHGMPFPRSKANSYEYSNHVPFVVMWGDQIVNPGRRVSDYVSFIDVAPTIMDLCGVEAKGMLPVEGKSIKGIINDNLSKKEKKSRETLILGRERHDYGRPKNQGYPIRGIIENNILYIQNLKPHLLPAGNPETGYLDVDGGAIKTYILDAQRRSTEDAKYYSYSFSPRPAEEMYDISKDKDCMNNLADDPNYAKLKTKLRKKLLRTRKATDDPRLGPNGDVFDSYPYDQAKNWNFYERVVSGEVKEPWKQTKWVTPTDYDAHPDNKR